jgi:pimeloyl-ACP methyl ester carboxylesterase
VEGLRLLSMGPKSPRATVICSHGGLDRGASFSRIARRLSEFEVWSYDRRGYQGSRALTPFSLEHHIDDLATLAADAKQRGPVILFGHSFGGLVAFGVAVKHPELVDLVVGYESPFPWIKRLGQAGPPREDEDFGAASERFFRNIVSNDGWDRLSAEEQASRRADGPALVQDLTDLYHSDIDFDLEHLRVPAAYVFGDGPFEAHYIALGSALQQSDPDIHIIKLLHASHGAHLANPDQLADTIIDLWRDTCALP